MEMLFFFFFCAVISLSVAFLVCRLIKYLSAAGSVTTWELAAVRYVDFCPSTMSVSLSLRQWCGNQEEGKYLKKKTDLCHKNVAFKTRAPQAGFLISREHIACSSFDLCWIVVAVCAWTKAVQRALLCEMNMPERLFKVPLMAPGAIRLNRIPDMSLRSSISEIMPGAYLCDWLNEELRRAVALCLSLWWHFILMSWLTRNILKSESLSYERDLFEEKKNWMGHIMNV